MKTTIRKLISALCLLTTLAAQTASGFYDPNLQCWLTLDPIGEEGGINLYQFVGNDPVNWYDPYGFSRGARLPLNRGGRYGLPDPSRPVFRIQWQQPVPRNALPPLSQLRSPSQQRSRPLTQQEIQRIFYEPLEAGCGSRVAGKTTTALQPFFPPNGGFLGPPTRVFLFPGQRIDRFGGTDFSRFFSPTGTPKAARSLPPETAKQPLRSFEVLKPFEVEIGTVAPAFGELGFGTQIRTPIRLEILIERGIIREIEP